MMLYIFSLGMVVGLSVFCSKHKHFLLTLLSVEFIVIFLFLVIYFYLQDSYKYFSLIYLTFSACEGALGLSILVSISRIYGSDYISSLSLTY